MLQLFVRRNIIYGYASYPVCFYQGTTDTTATVSIQNNPYHSNGTNAVGYHGVSVTTLTENTLTPADPRFVSSLDLHLQSGPPAIGAGIDVGVATDISESEGLLPETSLHDRQNDSSSKRNRCEARDPSHLAAVVVCN